MEKWNKYCNKCAIEDGGASMDSKTDCATVVERLKNALARQFNFALNSATKGLFAGEDAVVDANIDKFLGLDSGNVRHSDLEVADMLSGLWADLRRKLRPQLDATPAKLGIPPDIAEVIDYDLDFIMTFQISSYCGDWSTKESPKDRCVQQREYIKEIVATAREIYVEKFSREVLYQFRIRVENGEFKVSLQDDVESMAMRVESFERELAS